jgi:hypothetical protein
MELDFSWRFQPEFEIKAVNHSYGALGLSCMAWNSRLVGKKDCPQLARNLRHEDGAYPAGSCARSYLRQGLVKYFEKRRWPVDYLCPCSLLA